MRLISWAFSLAVFAVTIVFVLQNRMQVTISFWPFDAEATLPVSFLSLGVLILGFVMGSIVSGVLTLGPALERRRLKREVASLQAKLKTAEEKQTGAVCSGPTILSHGRYQPLPPLEEKPARFAWFKRKKT